MAGPIQDFGSPRKDLRSAQARPGRALLLMLVVIALLAIGMVATSEKTPRLGIDLAGGTSITLSATDDARNEGAVTQRNLETAVGIIERRVNGLGVSEAEVQSQGDRNIVVNIPKGTDEEQARAQVGTTASLAFRPVLASDIAVGLQDPTPGTGEATGEPTEPEPTEEPGGTEESPAETGEETGGQEQGTDGENADGEGTSDQSLSPGAPSSGTATASQASFRTQDAEETEDAQETGEPESAEDPAGAEEQAAGEDEGASGEEAAADGAGTPAVSLTDLDCSTQEARAEAKQTAANAPDDENIVVCDQQGVYKYELGPIAVPGTDLTDASAVYDSQQGKGWIVTMDFSSTGSDKFADITAQLATQAAPRNQFAIVLDGEVVSAPRVSERLVGSAIIEGGFTQETAEELANVLKFGALPITFEIANVTTVSPTLGGEQLRAGLIAGGIGLLLVVCYLIFYYRALALVAVTSLLVMGGLTYMVMTLLGPAIGFALSLPAVCGAIVAIGITADSFIVYFERIRDEVREGRPVRAAIERAWPRARRTILVSDVVSFLAAIVLFVVSVGSVQGFAFVLGLTTALDVAVVFWLTKPLLSLAARRPFFARGHKWSGLDPKRLGARPPIRRSNRRPATVPADPKEA